MIHHRLMVVWLSGNSPKVRNVAVVVRKVKQVTSLHDKVLA